jgi:hypothetical protein
MKQFALPKKKENKGKVPARKSQGNKTRTRPKKASVDHIMHLQKTIGNQAVQRMIKSGTLQLDSARPKPGDVYTREVDKLKKRVETDFSNPLSQQKATILDRDKQTGEILPANSSYQLTAINYEHPLMSNVETLPQAPQAQPQSLKPAAQAMEAFPGLEGSSIPSPVIQRLSDEQYLIIKSLVSQEKYTEALVNLCSFEKLGSGLKFKIQAVESFYEVTKEVPPGGGYGLTIGGPLFDGKPATIYLENNRIKGWVENDEIGDLINTIEHELIHVKQRSTKELPHFKRFGDIEEKSDLYQHEVREKLGVIELEAYYNEIRNTYYKLKAIIVDKEKGIRLPSEAQIAIAWENAQSEYKAMEPKQQLNFKWHMDNLIKFYPIVQKWLLKLQPSEHLVEAFQKATVQFDEFYKSLLHEVPSREQVEEARRLKNEVRKAFKKMPSPFQKQNKGKMEEIEEQDTKVYKAEFFRRPLGGRKKVPKVKTRVSSGESSGLFFFPPPPSDKKKEKK